MTTPAEQDASNVQGGVNTVDIAALTAAVDRLNRNERRNKISLAVLAAAVVVLVIVGILYYQSVQARRADNKNFQDSITKRTQQVACAFAAPYPDTIPYVAGFKKEFGCPPYDPSIAKLLKPSPTETP